MCLHLWVEKAGPSEGAHTHHGDAVIQFDVQRTQSVVSSMFAETKQHAHALESNEYQWVQKYVSSVSHRTLLHHGLRSCTFPLDGKRLQYSSCSMMQRQHTQSLEGMSHTATGRALHGPGEIRLKVYGGLCF